MKAQLRNKKQYQKEADRKQRKTFCATDKKENRKQRRHRRARTTIMVEASFVTTDFSSRCESPKLMPTLDKK